MTALPGPVRAPSTGLAVAGLMFNALVWGCSWWPFRQLNDRGLHTLWATALIFLIGTVLVLLWRPRTLAMLLTAPSLWLIALAAGLTNASFNWAVSIGPVVRVVLLFYLMPVWAAVLARWLLREPITSAAVLRIAVALGGALVVLWQPGTGLPLPASLADWLGLAGGVGFAAVNVLLRRHAALPSEARALAMFIGGAVIAGVPTLLQSLLIDPAVTSSMGVATRVGWPFAVWQAWWPLLLGFALALLASNMTLQYGAALLPANVTSVVMLSEVVFATLSAVLLGDEVLTLRTLAGGAMILGAALLSALGPSSDPPSGQAAGDGDGHRTPIQEAP